MRPRTLPTETAVLSGVWAEVRRDADARGVPERGVQLVTRLRARLDAVASRAGQQPSRPRVACLVGLDPPALPAAWVGELLAWAGGEASPPPDGDAARAVGPGELERADPDVVVFACAGGLEETRAVAATLLVRPGWNALRAVREGRVYVTGGDAARPAPDMCVAEMLEAFAELLHPAAFRFGHRGRAWIRIGPDGG